MRQAIVTSEAAEIIRQVRDETRYELQHGRRRVPPLPVERIKWGPDRRWPRGQKGRAGRFASHIVAATDLITAWLRVHPGQAPREIAACTRVPLRTVYYLLDKRSDLFVRTGGGWHVIVPPA